MMIFATIVLLAGLLVRIVKKVIHMSIMSQAKTYQSTHWYSFPPLYPRLSLQNTIARLTESLDKNQKMILTTSRIQPSLKHILGRFSFQYSQYPQRDLRHMKHVMPIGIARIRPRSIQQQIVIA